MTWLAGGRDKPTEYERELMRDTLTFQGAILGMAFRGLLCEVFWFIPWMKQQSGHYKSLMERYQEKPELAFTNEEAHDEAK